MKTTKICMLAGVAMGLHRNAGKILFRIHLRCGDERPEYWLRAGVAAFLSTEE